MLYRLRVGGLPRIDAFDPQQSVPCCKRLAESDVFPSSTKQALQTFTCLTKIGCKHEVGAFARLIAPNSHSALAPHPLFIHPLLKLRNHSPLMCAQFSAGLVVGGSTLSREQAVVTSTNIIVCTPGRLLQHMDETPNFSCDNLQVWHAGMSAV